jgi:acetyl esterase/lipase
MEQLKAGMKMMMEKGFAPKFDGQMDPIHLREVVQAAQERMPAEPGVSFIPVTYGGVTGEINQPENAKNDYIILYIHGGGLICGNAFSSRGYASVLAAETKRPVYTLDYRLAPENKFPACVEDAFAYYQGVLAENPDTPIFLIGESGGAYLCITTAMKCRDEGVKLPAGIVPYSAPIDFTGAIDRHFEGNKDFTVTLDGLGSLANMLIPEGQEMNPYASPYLDDFHGFPPVLLAWDESESLAVDQEVIVDKLRAQGTPLQAKSYQDCFHAFATAHRGTPESREILQDTIAFFEKYSILQ